MKYKDFYKWCNQRVFDGYWSMKNASFCLTTIETFKHIPFWKREKVWNKTYKNFILNDIVNPTNIIINNLNLKESDK